MSHAFTTVFDRIVPVLTNECGVSRAWGLPGENDSRPSQPQDRFNAIWDTGATSSAISQNVVDACGLKPISIVEVYGVHGPQPTEMFLIDLWLPNRVVVGEVQATLGELRGADILIGMDVIKLGDLAVTNFEGATMFSFRVPSEGQIDFAERARATPGKQTRQQNRQDRRKRDKAEKRRGQA